MKTFPTIKATAFMLSALAMTCFTACESEDEEEDPYADVTEKVSVDDVVIIPLATGKISIAGTVSSNKSLTKFQLVASDGETTYDLLENSESSKLTTEDGTVKTATVQYNAIPIDVYTLEVRTRLSTTKTATIGTTYSFEMGYGSSSTLGSYLNFYEASTTGGTSGVYTMTDFYDSSTKTITDETIASSITMIMKTSGSLASAQKASASALTAVCGSAYVGDNYIVTSDGCVASYTQTVSNDATSATIEGVVINSDLFTVDLSNITFE